MGACHDLDDAVFNNTETLHHFVLTINWKVEKNEMKVGFGLLKIDSSLFFFLYLFFTAIFILHLLVPSLFIMLDA